MKLLFTLALLAQLGIICCQQLEGYYIIIPKQSGLVAGIADNSYSSGARLVTQSFASCIESQTFVAYPAGRTGYNRLIAFHSAYCLTVTTGSYPYLIQDDCQIAPLTDVNFQFSLVAVSYGYYQIRPVTSSELLTLMPDNSLQLRPPGAAGQLFYFQPLVSAP